MTEVYCVVPVGFVHKAGGTVTIEVDAAYQDAMLGLEGFSHIVVLYWFHENDSDADRSLLQVHPRGDPKNPITGVFATHSPKRPNLIALSICGIRSINGTTITLDDIDARDGSPVLDIKCYIPPSKPEPAVSMPDWV